ncbi:zinc finger protein 569-like [Vespula squamosa]|uniref:Zinc finger protein 569-like n=1 Tax=Vespula squamosa TaxID=30214 RepID=A0ABD2A250_VESSQ
MNASYIQGQGQTMTIRGNKLLGVDQRTASGYQPVRMTARGQSSYKCPNCDRFYMRTSCLKPPLSSLYRAIVRRHCVLVNGNLKEFACNLCPRTYSTLRALRFHQRIECNREPKFTCGWCDYRTLRRTSLQRHMLRSYYSCELCGKGYNTLGSLKFHKNVECSREPSFACTYCIYKSRRRSNLHRHMKTTTPTTTLRFDDKKYNDNEIPVTMPWRMRRMMRRSLEEEETDVRRGEGQEVDEDEDEDEEVVEVEVDHHNRHLHHHLRHHHHHRHRILPFAGLKIPKASSFNYLGKKPAGQFPCNRCGRSYMRKDSLQRHTHWECGKEPQFHCPFCPQRCKRKAHWLRHIRRQHFEKIGDMEAHLLAYTPKLEID